MNTLSLKPFNIRHASFQIPLVGYISTEFNTLNNSVFQTSPLHLLTSLSVLYTLLHIQCIVYFANHVYIPHLTNGVTVIDPFRSVPYPPIAVSTVFNKWFGIPFTDTNLITRVRGPISVEILRTYHIPDIDNQCVSLLFETALRLALLHSRPLEIVRYIRDSLVHEFESILCLSNPVFVSIDSRSMTINSVWTLVYSEDKETSVILTNLHVKVLLDR